MIVFHVRGHDCHVYGPNIFFGLKILSICMFDLISYDEVIISGKI